MGNVTYRSGQHKQAGAVLAAVLMIVMVVTILGITAISTASLEGKLARNYQDRSQAFQLAERALQAGEQVLGALTTEPLLCTAAPCTCADAANCKVWERTALQQASLTESGGNPFKWWEIQNGSWWLNKGATALAVPTGSTAMYLIEKRSFVQNNAQANVIGSGLNYYTVTAIGMDDGSGAQVVLQSHFMKRFN